MKYVFPVIAVIALILGVISLVPSKMLGGQYNNNYTYFPEGANVGGTATLNDVAVNGTMTISGVATNTTDAVLETLSVTDTATLETVVVNGLLTTFGDATKATIQVGAVSKAGCIILGDSAAGTSPVYITATGETITASTTKPAACQ